MRVVGLHRLKKYAGWRFLAFAVLPVCVFIAFDLLDLDGSDAKSLWRHGLFVAEAEKDASANDDKGKARGALQDETARIPIATVVPGTLRAHTLERAIRETRIFARRAVSESHTSVEQSADPA